MSSTPIKWLQACLSLFSRLDRKRYSLKRAFSLAFYLLMCKPEKSSRGACGAHPGAITGRWLVILVQDAIQILSDCLPTGLNL